MNLDLPNRFSLLGRMARASDLPVGSIQFYNSDFAARPAYAAAIRRQRQEIAIEKSGELSSYRGPGRSTRAQERAISPE